MKKTLIIIALFGLMSFVYTERFITVKFSEQRLQSHWKNLNDIKKIVDESNLPHAQVKFILQSIDSLVIDIKKTARLDTTGLKVMPRKDSLNSNPNSRRLNKPKPFVTPRQ
jgi:hypothetical protein